MLNLEVVARLGSHSDLRNVKMFVFEGIGIEKGIIRVSSTYLVFNPHLLLTDYLSIKRWWRHYGISFLGDVMIYHHLRQVNLFTLHLRQLYIYSYIIGFNFVIVILISSTDNTEDKQDISAEKTES